MPPVEVLFRCELVSSCFHRVAEMGMLKLRPVSIGAGCTIGRSSVVFPGVVMEAESVLGACSLATKGRRILARQIWGGVSAEFIRNLRDDLSSGSDRLDRPGAHRSTSAIAETWAQVSNHG
jgi:carbonic anhydrase/acetyltransferase-like protein (isoleucine patch superfamily)